MDKHGNKGLHLQPSPEVVPPGVSSAVVSRDGAAAGARTMGCLDDATLDEFVNGRLAPEALAGVDEHLDGCSECGALVAALIGREVSGTAPVVLGELARGDVVGRYTVLEPVGRGAMGVVYAAYDPRLDRRIALKLLRPDAAAGARGRLLREAQAMARLAHPNVVTLYEAGEQGDAVYLAMELVAGRTLRAWLAEGSRSWREVRAVLVQAGEGLAAAHAAGIVHRDFKPDNVIVGDDGRVRVTDFGLARTPATEPGEVPAAPSWGELLVTATGALMGTPAYMAPEQLAGREADEEADQFAFCVTTYEALTGVRPFAGATLEELGAAIARGEVASGPRRAAVPAWLERAVRRGLSADPDQRHTSMRVLLAAMQADAARTRWRLAAALLAVAVAAVIAGVTTWRGHGAETPCQDSAAEMAAVWSGARAARVRAAFAASGAPFAESAAAATVSTLDRFAARWTEAHATTCRATWVTREQSPALLDARMHCLRRGLHEFGALLHRMERADAQAVRHAADAAEELPSLEACADVSSLTAMTPRPRDPTSVARLAEIERMLGELRAEAAAGSVRAATDGVAGLFGMADRAGYAPLAAEVDLFIALLYRRGGNLSGAVQGARRAVVLAEGARDERSAARAWLELAAAYGEQGEWEQVRTQLEHAGAAVVRMGSPAELKASLDYLRGLERYNVESFDEAEPLLIAARDGAPTDAGRARALTALGNLERARGRFEPALALHLEALSLDRARLGEGHPDLARHHHNVAGVLRRIGRAGEAREQYRQALAAEVAGAGPLSPAAGLTHNSLGILALEAGDTAAARRELEQALVALSSTGHPDTALALQNLGVLAAHEGDHTAALVRFEAALTMDNGRFSMAHERVARTLMSMGQSLAALGRLEEARQRLEQALDGARAARSQEARAIAVGARQSLLALTRTRVPARHAQRTRGREVEPGPTAPRQTAEPPPAWSPARPPPMHRSMGYGAAQSWDTE
jgi:tetratricopeptide (TPR) repeat protein